MKKTVCELFAGVGGFRLGLEKESNEWKTVWFSQWEPNKKKQWAHDCYVSHFGDIDDRTGIDISLVDKNEIPNHNLLVGGFPCQDYSVAKPLFDSKGLQGNKGVLWWQIRDTLQAKKPPFALFENVDRLLKSPAKQRGRDFGVILSTLADLDYSVEWRVINAAEYGAAQRRRRTFIFCYKNNTVYAKGLNAKEMDIQRKAVEVLSQTGFFAQAFPVYPCANEDISDAQLSYEELSNVWKDFQFAFQNTGWMTNGMIYTAKNIPITEKSQTIRSLMEYHVDEKYFLTDTAKERIAYLKSGKKIQRTAKNGHVYNFSEGPVAFPDSIDKPARTMLTSETSINRSTHVITDAETGKLRYLTPIEAERIQGFEDNWTGTVGMPHKFRYFCMGNALVVPLITRMAHVLDDIFQHEE